jgi:hypothetical protein
MARIKPQFVFGQHVMDWDDFSLFIQSIGHAEESSSASELVSALENIDAMQDRYRFGRSALLEQLSATRESEATDFRDRVFSLLMFLSEDTNRLIQPNYLTSFAEVFESVVLTCACDDGSLEPLALAGL